MKRITMHKRRNGHWCAAGSGSLSNSYNSPEVKDDAAADAAEESDDSEDDDQEPKANKSKPRNAGHEAKNYRLRLRETERVTDLRESVIFALQDAGLGSKKIQFALRGIDWSQEDDPEEVVSTVMDALDEGGRTTTGRTAPAMNNGRKKLTKETADQKAASLAKRFPALRGRLQ